VLTAWHGDACGAQIAFRVVRLSSAADVVGADAGIEPPAGAGTAEPLRGGLMYGYDGPKGYSYDEDGERGRESTDWMLGDAGDVGGGGRLQEDMVAVCPHCRGVVLTRTQDPHGRSYTTCQTCTHRAEPVLVAVEDHEWGDGYTMQAYSTPAPARRERARGLWQEDVVYALRAPQGRSQRRRMDVLPPQEPPTRPT
jgi:hypothetical protein